MWLVFSGAKIFGRRARACTFCTANVPPLGLLKLRERLDQKIVGHHELKDALLLALVSREHIYVEGPPGTAKTQLAETAAQTAGMTTFFYQLHRDTRLHELVGDTVVKREREADGGELIHQSLRPGGILVRQVAVLDDISRAPGEALNVLFRILNERKFCIGGGDIELPLVTAIATGNPCRGIDDYYAEPLDPASLDRFTFHVRLRGLIEADSWSEALRVMALHSGNDCTDQNLENEAHKPDDIAATFNAVHAALPGVSFGPELRELLLQVLQTFRKEIAELQSSKSAVGATGGGLLTDRTFLAKGPLVCRAHALMHGRSKCEDEDLIAIKHLTAFRLPEQLHARVEEIIEDVVRKAMEQRSSAQQEGHGKPSGNPSGTGTGSDGAPTAAGNEDASQSPTSDPRIADNEKLQSQAEGSAPVHKNQDVNTKIVDEKVDDLQNTEQHLERGLSHRFSETVSVPILASLQAVESFFRRLTGIASPSYQAKDVAERLIVEKHVEPLLVAIAGRMRKRSRIRNRFELSVGGSGQPRGWRSPRSMNEMGSGNGDVDAVAGSEWARDPTPCFPLTVARELNPRPGGRLAVIRDISASMEGAHATWSMAVVSSLLQMCEQRAISVGYLEFNHEPFPFRGGQRGSKEGEFFTRDYESVINGAKQAQNSGGTNIQFALRVVINEYAQYPLAVHDCEFLQGLGRELFLGTIRGGLVYASSRSHVHLHAYGIHLPSAANKGFHNVLFQRNRSPESHVLLVTDGFPTFGCPRFVAEREEALAMGLCVHTVYIGDGNEYPEAIGELAEVTGGVRFQAMIDYESGSVKLFDKSRHSAPADVRRNVNIPYDHSMSSAW